jgi:hypothetical protein
MDGKDRSGGHHRRRQADHDVRAVQRGASLATKRKALEKASYPTNAG